MMEQHNYDVVGTIPTQWYQTHITSVTGEEISSMNVDDHSKKKA